MTGESELDSLDFCSGIIDEIALEGLDGITLQALWVRLKQRPNFSLSVDESSRPFIWNVVKCHPGLEIYTFDKDRPQLVPFDRFLSLDEDFGVVVEPADLPVDPYPFEAVDDKERGVRGSCTTYYERTLVTDVVRGLSLAEVEAQYGDRLAAVASQRLRNLALVPSHIMDVDSELSLGQYLQMERIGRSRYHGEVTVGQQGLGVLLETPKNVYYIRKKLIEYRIITKQHFFLRLNTGKGSQGRLYHLPRFFTEFRPKYQLVIEHCVEELRRQPNHIMLVSKLISKFHKGPLLKKVAKFSDFQRFIKFESVPYRTLYPDASKAEWCIKNTGGERGVRIYRLLDPEVNVRRVLDEEEETEAEFQSAVRGQLKFPVQSRLSLVHSMERQAYLLLLSHGASGMDSNVLRRELGMSQLDARALLKAIASVPGATFTYREDVGRIRITKYVASRFGHLNSDRHSMSMEESMLKSMANKSANLDTSTNSWDGADKTVGALSSNDTWSGAPDGDGADAAVSEPIGVVERTLLAASAAAPRRAESADHVKQSPRPKSKDAAAEDAISPAKSDVRTAESKKLFQFSSSAKEGGAEASKGIVSPPTTPAQSKSEGERLEGTTATETSPVAGAVASKAGSSEEGAVAASAVAAPKKHEHSEFYVVGDDYMLEVFDPSTGDRLTEQVNIPLEDTSLFSKSSSSRSMKRTRLVLEIVQRLKIIDHAFQLKRMVQSAEDEVMTPTKMDRRSFWRILKRLSDARLIRNYRLTLTKDTATHQSHMVADYSIGFDSELLSSCIEGVRIGFLLNLRGSIQHSGSSSTTAEAAAAAWEVAAGGQEDGSAGGTDGQSSPEKRLGAWSDSGVSGAKHQDRPHPDAVRSSAATSYQLTKFRRLHQLHEVLYYLGREYSGSEQLEQGPLIDALIERFPDVERHQLPRVYNADAAARLLATRKGAAASSGGRLVGWEMFMSPLPAHRGWGPGWMMLCDVLMRLPLCVFVRLVNVMYQTPLMARYIQHPLLCNLPVTHLPSEIVSCLRWKRKYMFSVHDDVSRLCFMGIIQFGQQLTSKDQVFLYLNRNASILDTVNSTEGFYTVNPDLQYPVKYYHFSSMQTLRDYWTDLKTISLSTPLGMRQQMEGKRMLVEEAFDKSLLQQAATERLPDQAEMLDTGAIPGDQLGAGGIDSALFTHMLRNWRDKFRDVVKLEESGGRKRRASAKDGDGDSEGPTLRDSLSKLRKQRASNKPSSHSSRSTLVQNLRSDGSKDDEESADTVGADGRVGTKRLRSPIGVATDGGVRMKRRRRLTPTADAKRCSTGSTVVDKEAGGDATTATSVGDSIVGGSVTAGSSGLIRQRRCRRSPANRLVKPRKRNPRPVIDDVDRRALQMLAKRRCCWSDRETAFLLLARVALQLISDSYKLPPGQYSTARDALHKYIPESVDKTTMSVRRRICFALKNECNSAHASLLYQEYRVRDDVRAIIGDKPITQSRHNQDFVYPEKFNQLMKLLTNRAASDDNMGVPLPDDYATLSRECRFYEGDERLLGLRLSPVALETENDVLKHTLTGFILSYLAAAEDKNPSTIVVYRTMSHYSEHLTQSAMLQLTRAEVVSRHKKSKMLNKRGSRATPFVDMSYSLSIRFRHRLITRYQYSVFAESYLWFKTLLLNSLTSELGCVSLQSVTLGGQAAAIVSLVALDKLEYDITVPENIILMNDAQRKVAESGLLSSLDAADGDTSGGPTVPSVIVPAPNLRASTSRVVLMSLRERQANTEQLALLDSSQTRANSHIYHEQLQVAPCEVSLRLRPPDQPPASAASASQDASSGDSRIAVDSSYIVVSPEKIKAVKERNSRLLDGVSPDREETLLRVSVEHSWSAEQLEDARQLLATLDRAGVMGLPASDAPTVSGLPREWLCQLVSVLSDCQLLLCVGRVVLRLVTRHNAQSWILHSYHLSRLNAEKLSTRIIDAQLARDFPGLDPVFFVPTPWRRVCGTLNRRVLDRLMGTVLGYCMEFPGKLMSEIQEHFHPCLTPCHTRLLLEELSVIGAVDLYEDSFEYAASLFSTREDISCQRRVMDLCSLPARVSVEPTVGAILRHSCFIGDKTYNQEFISEFGM